MSICLDVGGVLKLVSLVSDMYDFAAVILKHLDCSPSWRVKQEQALILFLVLVLSLLISVIFLASRVRFGDVIRGVTVVACLELA